LKTEQKIKRMEEKFLIYKEQIFKDQAKIEIKNKLTE